MIDNLMLIVITSSEYAVAFIFTCNVRTRRKANGFSENLFCIPIWNHLRAFFFHTNNDLQSRTSYV